jgi:hypothetical protein
MTSTHKLGGKLRERLDPVLSPFPLNRNSPSLDVAKLSETIKECLGAQRE